MHPTDFSLSSHEVDIVVLSEKLLDVSIEFGTDNHVSIKMKCNHFDDLLSSHLLLLSGQNVQIVQKM